MAIPEQAELAGIRVAREIGMEAQFGATALLGDSAHEACVAKDPESGQWYIIKPIDHKKAIHEQNMYEAMKRVGVPVIPFPAGQKIQCVDLGITSALVMPFVKLRPLTQLNWSANAYSDAEQEMLSYHALNAMHMLAMMHKRGLTHGDFQSKNNGLLQQGRSEQRQICYDFENSKMHSSWIHNEPVHADMAADIVQFEKSIFINRYLDELPLGQKMDAVVGHTLNYAEKLIGRAMELTDSAMKVAGLAINKTEDWISEPGTVQRARRRFTH